MPVFRTEFTPHRRRDGGRADDSAAARMTRLSLRSGITLGTILVLGACGSNEAPAGLLLLNGRVYTLDWGEPDAEGNPAPDAPVDGDGWRPDAEAVAVRDGRIVFVGTRSDAERFRGGVTSVKDLDGATVIPGLVDSHTHVVGLGRGLSQVDLRGVDTEAQAVARVAERRASVPPGEWIIGWGWDEGAWANRYPTMELLSSRFPDNPVVLRSLHGFATWGNQRAFEAAGIDASTPSPTGGEILRDANGDPTGVLLNRAGALLTDAIPVETPDQLIAYLHAGLVAMAEAGYTAIHDAGLDADAMAALEALERDGQLPIRVYAMLSARDEPLVRRWIARGPDQDTESMLRTRAVKAFYDGALGSRGARLLADYSDRPGLRGVSGNDYGFDQALVREAMDAGFQVAVHAIGDAGNRETLDFFERVFAEDPPTREGRHRIEHAQVVHPDDFARFAQLSLIASMQPPHAVEDMAWAEDRLGPDRIRGAYAWRTMRRNGVRLIFNSDLTGSDHNIFYGLHSAITRRDKQLEPAGGWYPDQAMTPEEAIRGYTSWAAYAGFMEDEAGIIAPGRLADLTVLDIDPFTIDPDRLLNGNVILTVVNGEVVYDAAIP